MTPLPQRAAAHRRKIHYVDKTVQKWLLLALVILEAGLVAAMVWLMHWRLSQVIEDNLYRVHLAKAASMLHQLMQEASLLLGIFLLANVVALLVADGIWRRYVNSLLRSFMTLVGKTGRLDFSADPEVSGRHRLLELAATQRARERLRLGAIREQMAGLDAEASGAGDQRKVRELLDGLNRLVG
jgi:hypothetical protein